MAVAAYAAVVSLIHVLHQIQHPSRNRLHLDRNRIETLREKVSFLQEFLELYSQIKSKEIEDLAMQICDVAVEAEDVIDIHVVDQLRAISVDESGRALSLFCQDIDRVIGKIESINKEVIVVKEGMAGQEQLPRVCVPAVLTAPSFISSGKNTVVGFDEHLVRIMDVLTNTGLTSDRQIVSLVGMGGIGKTTLAIKIFEHPYIEYHFHMRFWVTISPEYSIQEILLVLLQNVGVLDGRKSNESGADLAKLGEKLYKSLSGRRYLIVIDDLWNTKVWDDLMVFFPDNRNGSRIMVTTRLSSLAISVGSQNPYLIDFLNEDQSWSLLCEKAFAQEGCPVELEESGRNIAKSCKGLPLAIVVIGGLLSSSSMTREYWEFVAENVNSLANSENDEHCLKILSLSFNHLPIHLKPCFLYTGLFLEFNEIKVSELIKLWVAGGFLKPITGKNLEEIAQEYLKDLIDRNLILMRKWTHSGKMKMCSIHDLLRVLCIRESENKHLFSIPRMQKTRFKKYEDTCFLCNRPNTRTRIYLSQVIVASQATSPVSCSVCDHCRCMYAQINGIRLVRVIDAIDGPFSDKVRNRLFSKEILHPSKLRYFSLKVQNVFEFVPASMPLLWNLQTLIIQHKTIFLPCEIWEMPQLRHLIVDRAILPDPASTETDRTRSTIVLDNLRTLSTILNFRCSKEVLERIPNLRKLKIHYKRDSMEWSCYSLHNLAHLHKLESLYFELSGKCYTLKMVVFPHSLKRLILKNCGVPWEEMTIIGSLPNLEVLKLYNNAFVGPVWNLVEEEFRKLKLLLIERSYLECWGAEKIHFPNLESLVLRHMDYLKEIPAGIVEIETLQLIDVSYCSGSIINSAKEILDERENLGIEGLHLVVRDSNWKEIQEQRNLGIEGIHRLQVTESHFGGTFIYRVGQ